MSETAHRYTAELADRIELAWQDRWEAEGTFDAPNPSGPFADPEKVASYSGGHMLVLDMFPYPSGAGLHVGHPLGYIATDVFSRYHRMLGKNVLHCLGYDAFGLPAEQYAVQTGQHPRVTTEANIDIMARQLRRLGLGLDNRRAIRTMDPDYYRWTQWIFLQIFNAWYDTEAERADGGRGRARPIAELVEEYASGARPLPAEDGRDWADLSPAEQADIVDSHRLAYASEAPVNWAPGLGSVVANEEVTNEGRSERGNFPVFKRNLRQWMMRITAYSDRLADDLDRVQWPDKVKAMQRNWIGRSHGARVAFPVAGLPEVDPIEVFTTRPDTLFGATFMVLAPEHPLVDALVPAGEWAPGTNPAWTGGEASPEAAVTAYRRAASRKSDVERQIEGKDKTGVFTGAYAVNPATGAEIPVFVADYVLMGYGTGAIMAVPGQDERDWHFADNFDLPRIRTVQPTEGHPEDEAFTGEGPAINSANDEIDLNGKPVAEAKAAMIDWLVERGHGEATVSYKLRDWLFSRQRYWGEPFPIVFDADGVAHGVPESMLPVELPEVPDYSPRTFDPDDAASEPEPPLGRVREWVEVDLDLGDGRGVQRYRRETNTMPNWAGSCWYYLRYLDPENREELVSAATEEYWIGPRETPVAGAPKGTVDPGGVDLYIGGVEHAVLHLLYARFWHKVLFDLGHVSSEEPFRTYFSQGYIQAPAYRDDRGQPVEASEVEEVVGDSGAVSFTWQGQPVTREFGKIGKSLKNMVSPDDMYAAYGADTLRLYEMGMGPLDQSKPWDTRAIVGSQRFLQRLWRNVVDEESGEVRVVDEPVDDATLRVLHRTIDAVRRDYDELGFNTAIARLIELNNALTKLERVPRDAAEQLVLMVAPLAPHIAEELWSRLGHAESLTHADFPVADPALLVEDTVTCVVQIRGKVRDRLEVASDITEDELREKALALPKVVDATAGGVRTVIVRAPRLVNVVPM
ncbi:leucyl-tRNA synthetase [Knoellia flava TL1]|uniref:Leucine--tRNA ligase n=2 Tax=Knoellia flava TaxID=913969 RepID=A0A8H9FUK9_9MICO|nr:leucine--tRNA ligase [Knoellia flava]KGN29701.1 leucyl-tRNA synthetase [Knoellia flava TL1]GGB86988.1 leucine--tRNA ligase [Knoellia flava]